MHSLAACTSKHLAAVDAPADATTTGVRKLEPGVQASVQDVCVLRMQAVAHKFASLPQDARGFSPEAAKSGTHYLSIVEPCMVLLP